MYGEFVSAMNLVSLCYLLPINVCQCTCKHTHTHTLTLSPSLSLSPSLPPSLPPSLSLSLSPSLPPSLSLSLSLPPSLPPSLSLSPSLPPSLPLPLSLSPSLSLSLSLPLPLYIPTVFRGYVVSRPEYIRSRVYVLIRVVRFYKCPICESLSYQINLVKVCLQSLPNSLEPFEFGKRYLFAGDVNSCPRASLPHMQAPMPVDIGRSGYVEAWGNGSAQKARKCRT